MAAIATAAISAVSEFRRLAKRLIMSITKRRFMTYGTLMASYLAAPAVLRAQPTVIRWADELPGSSTQSQMIERIGRHVAERSGGRLIIESFPNGQLGSGRDVLESVLSGAVTVTSNGPAALGSLVPQLSILEAPYIWRDTEHLARLSSSPLFASLKKQFVTSHGVRIINVSYYGKRHITTGNTELKTVADMRGFRLRVPPAEVYTAMASAWGARASPINFNELYIALSQGAIDGQENPLPTIAGAKLAEVQKYLILTGHIIAPRLIIANDTFFSKISTSDWEIFEDSVSNGIEWQNFEFARQEQTLLDDLKHQGMIIVEPDIESFRKPVIQSLPITFQKIWGEKTWDSIVGL
ncbi:DctP family TRAP transporter solute-binding subunit [Agrobacterium sp. CNPSo 2736]|uniref:DctP family TRAP transporter solute-binding subunit n=1 Tax=Agrobacterium sp. CNPSo 2736 TaxID=2499627 RepID=UPI001FE197D6|nr:DctP family TRAP transporter solute-binding subunit [Agrobacterium sp. CNPSo 2736]